MSIQKVLHQKNSKPVLVWTEDVDQKSLDQLSNVASMPFIYPHVAAMPDVHLGKGATIGSVIPTSHAVIPAAVGVDLGCGVIAVRLNITADHLPDDLKALRLEIERTIPCGRTKKGGRGDVGAWDLDHIPRHIAAAWYNQVGWIKNEPFFHKYPGLVKKYTNTVRHLGTLGTGNHFIEICLDDTQRVWVMLHSGSRGIGNRIGTYFIKKAKEDMKKWMIELPDPDLAYIPQGADYFKDYLNAVKWAQNFALVSRELMMESVLTVFQKYVKTTFTKVKTIQCHHNFMAHEHHFGKNVIVTRKGAIRAREGDLGIIPGSMGDKSFIVRGKGEARSLCSCSHGAGRKMSRTQAKAVFSVEDLIQQTDGIECSKDQGVLDEIPGAYKPIEDVMANQDDLVDVLFELRQILNVKGLTEDPEWRKKRSS